MKKSTLLLSLSALFAAGLFFTSCSSEKNMVIEKRHYGNGFYIHHSGKHQEVVSNANSTSVASENIPTNSFVATTEKNVVANNSVVLKKENTTPAISSTKNYSNTKQAKHFSAVRSNAIAVEKNVAGNDSEKINATKKAPSNSGGGDVPAILLILLCLLLPPLAVFLSEGGLTTKFWIDLILCLLLFLPGVIYAFIVCFA